MMAGFPAALLASALPRKARGTHSGLVSFFSRSVRSCGLPPEGFAPVTQCPKTPRAVVRGVRSVSFRFRLLLE
jgi:hypothetical protein